jgi:hypothetical protein
MAKNTNLKMVIHNAETNEYTERDYTSEEIAAHEAALAAQANAEAAAEAKAEQRAALLERLGITAEEAQLLLGGN